MATEVVLSPVLVEMVDEELAKKTFAKLTQEAVGLGGFIKDDLQKVGDGYMITYAFPDEEKRKNWKQHFNIQ